MGNRTCSVTGCERSSHARGWCNNHYRKWQKYGDPTFVYQKTDEHKESLRQSLMGHHNSPSGQNHPGWKDLVSYQQVHRWARKNVTKVGVCRHCGQRKKTELANVSQQYLKSADDWIELCRCCHKIFDDEQRARGVQWRIHSADNR